MFKIFYKFTTRLGLIGACVYGVMHWTEWVWGILVLGAAIIVIPICGINVLGYIGQIMDKEYDIYDVIDLGIGDFLDISDRWTTKSNLSVEERNKINEFIKDYGPIIKNEMDKMNKR